MFNWFRKKILAKNSSNEWVCYSGSYNTETGETTGKDVDKFSLIDIAWGEPVFIGTVSIPWDTYYSSWFSTPKHVYRRYELYSLYKRVNLISKVSEYYYYREGIKKRIDSNAFEYCKEVIPLDEN